MTGFASQWLVAFGWTWGTIGIGWGFLSGDNTIGYPTYGPTRLDLIAAEALLPALLYAPFGLLALALGLRGRWLWRVLAVLWLVCALLGGSLIAAGYAASLGATWLPWEPFVELYWHPVWLPLLWLVALAAHLWATARTV